MNISLDDIRPDIERAVKIALEEDVGSGDITAQLIDPDKTDNAEVITREDCVICGIPWVNETYRQLGGLSKIQWHVADGDFVSANTTLLSLSGNTRTLLTGERTALNFLQLLSGVATKAKGYAQLVEGSTIKILDTRKTLPGLRTAQKYAVACGGCHNHRIGLFDAFLIKENHIAACGGIEQAVEKARKIAPEKLIEVEVETMDELNQAIRAKAQVIMLDNFSPEQCREASIINSGSAMLESSGNINLDRGTALLSSNIDYISTGDLTKNNTSIDLSLRLI